MTLLTTLENIFNRTAAVLATERVPKDVTSLGRILSDHEEDRGDE